MKTAGKASSRAGLFGARRPDSNKSDYGKILIVAGSEGMSGAAVLCATAALRAGAGLVTVACPVSVQPTVACCVPEAMTLPLPQEKGVVAGKKAIEALDAWLRSKWCDLILAGPGLGTGLGASAVLDWVLKSGKPLVLDADALNCLAARKGWGVLLAAKAVVLTPHPGEAARLLGMSVSRVQAGRGEAASRLARLSGGIVVLKGNRTLIVQGATCRVNHSGGPELAKGGSGDVLSGLIAGLWAQRGKERGFAASAYECACAAVFSHGICGEMAARRLTQKCVLASDLFSFLPEAFRRASKQHFS